MKRKIVAGLLTAVMLCAVGCGNSGVTVEDPEAETSAPAEEAAEPEAAEEAEAPAEDAAESESAGSGMVVAFSQMEMNNAWRVAETGSIQDEAEKRGVELIYTDAGGDTAKQVSDVEDIVNQKPDVIMMAPREYEGMAPALEAAKAAGIPVLLLDRETAGVAGEDYLAFVGADFYWEGQECAKKVSRKSLQNTIISTLSPHRTESLPALSHRRRWRTSSRLRATRLMRCMDMTTSARSARFRRSSLQV